MKLCICMPRAFSTLVLGIGLLAVNRSCGQTVEQVIQLEPGWNAIYLEVQPSPSDCNTLLAGVPVESVWFWNGGTASTMEPSSQKPLSLADLKPQDPWLVYFPPDRPEHILTTLHHLQGDECYLVKVTAKARWIVRGRPRLPRIQWNQDSYNLVGFPVGAGQGSHSLGPTFAAFLAGSHAHIDSSDDSFHMPIYALRNGTWETVRSDELMEPGRAYWIYAKGPSTYYYNATKAQEDLCRRPMIS